MFYSTLRMRKNAFGRTALRHCALQISDTVRYFQKSPAVFPLRMCTENFRLKPALVLKDCGKATQVYRCVCHHVSKLVRWKKSR